MALGFVDLEKAFDTAPREMVMATLRWMGVPVPNGKQELQDTMEEWNGLFTRHGLKLNLEKTEVLHIDHQKEELDIELEGNKLIQGTVSCT